MTNRFLSEFDAIAHEAFRAAGMAEEPADARYTPACGAFPTVPCRVMVDRNLQRIGFAAQAVSLSTSVRVLLADIGGSAPTHGAAFVIGGERFVVDELLSEDESAAVCLVKPERRTGG